MNIDTIEVPKVEAKPTDRVVVYSGTRKVYKDMVTAAKSLIAHTKVDRVYFMVEDSKEKFPLEVPDWFKFVNVVNQKYFMVTCPNRNSHLTYMVLMRAAFHRIFSTELKVLQLDCDTVVTGDIGGLWDDYDMTDYYFACVKEPECCKGGKDWRRFTDTYYNMGVALMNLEKLRDGKGDRIIRQINFVKYNANEQDAINEWCKDQILELPNIYNAGNDWTGFPENSLITHFAGVMDWRKEPLWKKYETMSWDEALEMGGYK